MALRTDDAAVRSIINLSGSFVTTPHMETANNLVTRLCTGSGYDDETLELIERWLSAHFCAVHNQVSASETAGDTAQSMQYKVGMALANTMWGQQALVLDSEGNLTAASNAAETGGGKRTRVTWLGKKCK